MDKIILSNYTVPGDRPGAAIGEVKANGEIQGNISFSLSRDPAGKFEIAGNLLKLKDDSIMAAAEPSFYCDIVIAAADERQSLLEEFRLVRDDFLSNRVVAHRGRHKYGPGSPNSLSAFKSAIEKGCAAFECDVLFSMDKKVVVAHGPTTACDGGKPDMPIHASRWELLNRVDLGNGDHIPLLEDVLRVVAKQNKTRIVIEVKETVDNHDLLLAGTVCKIVDAMKAQAWVYYIGFNYAQLLEILKKNESARCSPLEHCYDDVSRYVKEGMWGVDFAKERYDRRLVRACKKAGLKLNSWTIDEPAIMKKFIDWDFDFITTDNPDECLSLGN